MIAAGLFDAMLDAGFNPPNNTDGEITRFSTNGKTHNKDGWLVVFDDSGACFGCWREGTRFTWSDKSKFETMTQQERDAFEFKRRMAMQQAEFEREQRQNFAASESLEEWQNAPVCESHAYLERKSVAACENLRVGLDGRLIVPVFESSEKIQSLQYIDSEGKKQFKTDGKMKGGFFVVGDIGADCYLCEGLATALTINSATGKGVIVAFSASNMPVVYEKFKTHNVTVCADNDAHGVGLKYANECKGAKVVYPPVIGQDFNDIGIEGCKAFFGVDKNKDKPFLVPVSEIMNNVTPPNWLMKGWIEYASMGIIFGESGAGKSLFTLDWAFCMANGLDWHGNKIKQCSHVLYIAGEGGRGFAMRIQALQQKYEMKTKDNIFFSSRSVDLLDKKSAQQIIDSVASMELKPAWIVIDTLHRNMNGDENSAADIALFLDSLEVLRDLYGCAVYPVHHSGLSDKGRVRGSSSIKGGMDAEYCVTKGNDFEVTITCTKMKDAPKPPPIKMIITPVDLEGDCWTDTDTGLQTQGVYLTYGGIDTSKTKDLDERDALAFDAMKLAIEEVGIMASENITIAVENTKIVNVEVLRKYVYSTTKGKNKSRDFDRSIESLRNRRYIGVDGEWCWLMDE
jgi:archaellum biogenesis ATPase FlaH